VHSEGRNLNWDGKKFNKMTHFNPILLMLVAAVLNAAAQLFVKFAVGKIAFKGIFGFVILVFTNKWILGSLFFYALSFGVWAMALKNMSISVATSVFMISYVLTVLGGVLFFHETLNLFKIMGILLVVGGVALMTRSA
jgi:multidrug transporter EmrE-like cation transporter